MPSGLPALSSIVWRSAAEARAHRHARAVEIAAVATKTSTDMCLVSEVAHSAGHLCLAEGVGATHDVVAGGLVSGSVDRKRMVTATRSFKVGRGRRKKSWTQRWMTTSTSRRMRRHPTQLQLQLLRMAMLT
jgi:hypothetical protein